jgi:predicted TIM-barrel fold metal-dependent hydrolase
MTKSGFDPPRRNTLSRRGVLGLASAGTVFTFWQRKAHGLPAPERFFDRLATERIADRDPGRTPILVDAQTHVWWRAGGIRQMSERGEHFLKSLAGSRAAVVGHPVPVADMGRVMFLEDVFLDSETDIAFLNSFGMRAAFDGVDLFPPREAAFIRSMAPSRIRVLGTVDPPDGASAIESLIYQCETIKIDGLKLYPPGPDVRGWVLDDEKNTYPLFEALRRHGVKNVCVHKGMPGLVLEEYCHTDDVARAATAFPDLNFIVFHSAFPWEAELAGQAKASKVKKSLCRARHSGPDDADGSGAVFRPHWESAGRLRRGSHSVGYRHAANRTATLADRGLSDVHDTRRARCATRLLAADARGEEQDLW